MDQHHDPVRDRPLRKEWDLGNNKLIAEPKDPHGFWWVHFAKGQVPEKLQGAYTTIHQLEKAVEGYLEEKKREVVKKED